MTAPRIATVFGGTGFLGHAVIPLLAAKGYVVRVPTRDVEKAKDLRLMGTTGQIVPLTSRLRADSAVAEALQGADVAINLIGILTETKNETFQSSHVETAARLARLARAEGVARFAHVSALGISMDSPSRYARTKAVGEEAVRAFFPSATIFRPSVMFGPRDAFLHKFADLSRFSPLMPLIGRGESKLQPVYVGDVAKAIVESLSMDQTKGKTFALGGPHVLTLRDILFMAMTAAGKPRRFMPLPWGLASFLATFLEKIPHPPLTRDQLILLKKDNIVGARSTGLQAKTRKAGTFQDLGITPRSLQDYLSAQEDK